MSNLRNVESPLNNFQETKLSPHPPSSLVRLVWPVRLVRHPQSPLSRWPVDPLARWLFFQKMPIFWKNTPEKFVDSEKSSTFASQLSDRAFSSAGSEHLPYKQRVGGSNPSTPTTQETRLTSRVFFYPHTQKSPPRQTCPTRQKISAENKKHDFIHHCTIFWKILTNFVKLKTPTCKRTAKHIQSLTANINSETPV